MKTIQSFTRKMVLLAAAISFLSFAAEAKESTNPVQAQDTNTYVEYAGKVTDKNTNKPVVFASVYKVGSSIGTVTNSDGEFVIKIPTSKNSGELGISYIGYQDYTVLLSKLKRNNNQVELVPSPIPIKEVVIRTSDPYDLLRQAKAKINENYSTDPAMMTAFYRETIKQNRNYVAISEAVLDIYKSPYQSNFDYDRVKIFKGRKSMDVKKMDTVLFKLQGGPKTSLLLDVVKNPSQLLEAEYMIYYDYSFGGIIEVNDRQTYVINFDQKNNVDFPLYSGKIYLDSDNLAISGLEFSLSEKGIEKAASELVRKRPTNMKVDVESAHYLVSYRQLNNKWQLNHVRSEIKFTCKWDKKLFRSAYTTMLEMAVTDVNQEGIEKFKAKEAAKFSDIFADQVNYFLDEDYWGKYNYIKPDESIETAISRLNKKIKRQ